jgi:hypothetical protein
MSTSNGVIRIGRKGLKQFAFGEDGAPFTVDVVSAFQDWIGIDEGFRTEDATNDDGEPVKVIPTAAMPQYHQAAVDFVKGLATPLVGRGMDEKGGLLLPQPPNISKAEALDFLARLREQYDELAVFFRPKRREREESPGTSGAELRFSVEGEPSPSSTS